MEGVCTIKRTNEVVRERDAVWMEYSENGDPPYERLARIESVTVPDVNGNQMVKFRMLYRPEETVAGRKPFHGKQELFLTDHYHTQSSNTILRKCFVHPFLAYVKLKEVFPPEDYYFRLEYEHETGWFSPDIIEVYCKCLMPFNPDEYMMKCQSCKDWYHPACINMTADQAKQLADNFTCDREQCSDVSASASASASADPDMGEHKRARITRCCKCLVPFNLDEYMIKCQSCIDWYHPACINLTIDQAKLLADNFTCDREECSVASASASANPII